MKRKLGVGLVCVAMSLMACGDGENNSNGITNNGTNNSDTNNGSNNSGTNNNNGTNNNGTNNNGTNNNNTNNTNNNGTNNNTNNNGTNNTDGLMGDCSRLEVDMSGDGAANQIFLEQLDDAGNRVITLGDLDPDGVFDIRIERVFDAEGRVIEELTDRENDGSFGLHKYFEFDADGNQTSSRWDQGDDGTDDYVELQTYDADGQRTGLTQDGRLNANGGDVEEPADGTDDYVFTATWYDIDKPERFEWDVDGDGTADAISTWSYDGGTGDLTEFTMDGLIDATLTLPNGEPLPDPPLLEAADGDIDYRRFDIVTNAEGYIVEEKVDGRRNSVTGAFSQRADGTADLRTFEVDAEGRVTLLQFDEANDGSVDAITAFTYDADGNMTERTIDAVVTDDQLIEEVQDGTVDERIAQTWGEHGVTSYARDFGDDGTDEVTASWEWDAEGRITHFEVDGDTPFEGFELQTAADGTPDELIEQEFDAMGRRTHYRRELNGVLNVDLVWTFDTCAALQ